MNDRAASTDSPFGPGQSGFSKNVTRRFVAADTTVDSAMWRRTAAPEKPIVMPMRATPRSSRSSSVLSITLQRPTVVRQFDSSASPPMLTPLPAARINARATMLARELTCPSRARHANRPAEKAGARPQPLRWRLLVTAASA